MLVGALFAQRLLHPMDVRACIDLLLEEMATVEYVHAIESVLAHANVVRLFIVSSGEPVHLDAQYGEARLGLFLHRVEQRVMGLASDGPVPCIANQQWSETDIKGIVQVSACYGFRHV